MQEETNSAKIPGIWTSIFGQLGLRRWFAAATLTLLVLGIAITSIAYQLSSARAKLNERYSRLAASLAQETELRIKSYQTLAVVVGNAVYANVLPYESSIDGAHNKPKANVPGFVKKLTEGHCAVAQKSTDAAPTSSEPSLSLRDKRLKENQDNVTCEPHRLAEVAAASLVGDLSEQERPTVVDCPLGAITSLTTPVPVVIRGRSALFPISRPDPSSSCRNLECARETDANQSSLQPAPRDVSGKRLCLQIDVGTLVPRRSMQPGQRGSPQFSPERDGFAEVVLAEEGTCRLLYWSETETLARVAALPGCIGRDSKDNAASVAADTSTAVKGVPELRNLGGAVYHLFRQSVRSDVLLERTGMEARPSYNSGALVIVGLMNDRALDAEARRLSPMMFLLIVGMTVLAIASWPMAKLWLSGQTTRFKRIDCAWLSVSTILTAFVAAIVMLAFLANQRLEEIHNDRLTRLAKEVSGKLEYSFHAALSGLKDFSDELRDCSTVCMSDSPDTGQPQGESQRAECADLSERVRKRDWWHAEDDHRPLPLCETVLKKVETGPETGAVQAFFCQSKGLHHSSGAKRRPIGSTCEHCRA